MFKRYLECKDSGIEWVGSIPTHWKTIRTRFVLKTISGNGFPDDLQGKKEGEYPFYKCSDINTTTTFVDQANNYVDSDDVAKNKWDVIGKNSILLAKIGEALKKNHRKISRRDCLIDNNMMALSIKRQAISLKYLYYLMMLIRMEWFVNPGAVPSVDVSKFRSFRIPDLPKSEQLQIDAFLDDKTAKIDALIAKKERMIELLKEERSAVINQAVTKGLDPRVEMKDSGIEWAPRIPKEWHARPVKAFFDVQLGKMLQPESAALGDQLTPYLKALHVNWGNVATSDLPEMWASPSDLNQYGVRIGDLLVCEGGEVGRAGIVVEAPQGCIIQNALHRVRARENFDVRFLLYVLHSVAEAGWFSILCNKATIAHLTREKLVALQIPAPTGEEQKEITDYLDKKTAQIDGQVSREERSIELLKEYRTALISEAVTGKIDVRTCDGK